MNARSYSRLAALLFAIIAVVQFIRAAGGWQIVVNGTTSVPVWGKLDCLRGYRWAGVGRFRRITPELSKVGGAPMLTPLATTLGDAQGRSIAFRSKDAQSSVVTRALTSAISSLNWQSSAHIACPSSLLSFSRARASTPRAARRILMPMSMRVLPILLGSKAMLAPHIWIAEPTRRRRCVSYPVYLPLRASPARR